MFDWNDLRYLLAVAQHGSPEIDTPRPSLTG